jgi:CheY-like chemotaxis protein
MPALVGRRILVVEDSPVVAPFTVSILEDLGCVAVGPAPTLAAARQLIDQEDFDAAIMDVHIRGERVFGLCDLLEAQAIPFLLTSGYADWQVPTEWQSRPRLQKPYTFDQLGDALRKVLRAESAEPEAIAS